MMDGYATSLETMRRRKDGTLFPLLLTLSPIHDYQGELIGIAPSTTSNSSNASRSKERIAA
jgi:hypothetical protein